jgi:hypothetical protein
VTQVDNSVDLIYDVVKESLTAQQKQKDTLETKASMLIAFAGAIFGLLMSGYDTLKKFNQPSKILILVSIGLFALSVILLIIVTWVKKLRSDPNPQAITSPEFLNNCFQTGQLPGRKIIKN